MGSDNQLIIPGDYNGDNGMFVMDNGIYNGLKWWLDNQDGAPVR